MHNPAAPLHSQTHHLASKDALHVSLLAAQPSALSAQLRDSIQQPLLALARSQQQGTAGDIKIHTASPLLALDEQSALTAWRFESAMHVRILLSGLMRENAEQAERERLQLRKLRAQLQDWSLSVHVLHVQALSSNAIAQRVVDLITHSCHQWQAAKAPNGSTQSSGPARLSGFSEKSRSTTKSRANSNWRAWCDCCLDPDSEKALFAQNHNDETAAQTQMVKHA